MEVIEIESKEFNEIIKNGKVLIDCFATWCGPCKMLSPTIDMVANKINTCKFYKLDIDKCPDIANSFSIHSIPTLLLFKDGKLIKSDVGLKNEDELIEFIED